jgi:hypothetical protein
LVADNAWWRDCARPYHRLQCQRSGSDALGERLSDSRRVWYEPQCGMERDCTQVRRALPRACHT